MSNLIQNDNRIHSKLKTPTNCFITFEREDGPDLAEHYNKHIQTAKFDHYKKFLG